MSKTTPEVLFEVGEPEPIAFKFGAYYEKFTGFLAWLYNGMIKMYGEDEAKERMFRHMTKNSVLRQENAVPLERA